MLLTSLLTLSTNRKKSSRDRSKSNMAQVPNLDNAPINLKSLRYKYLYIMYFNAYAYLYPQLIILSQLSYRDQSLKELITILKNVRFIYIIWICKMSLLLIFQKFNRKVETSMEFFCLELQIRGKKCLVIDPKLGGSLSLIVQSSLLKATLSLSLILWYTTNHYIEGKL